MTTNGKLQAHVAILYDKFQSWRQVGQEIRWEAADRGVIDTVNGQAKRYAALANAVYRGAVGDSPKLRQALGLPPLKVEVEPCPDCGEVHEQLHQCPDELERQRQGPKRHRRCYEGGRGESGQRRVERVDAWLDANGWASLTEAVDSLVEVE